jgi:iron complex outermembrane receptor protein
MRNRFKRTRIFLLLCILILSAGQVMAQNIQVSGKITDQVTGEALPGVNIVVKGTTQGTTSNINGEYKIEISKGATLVFSFIGYLPFEIIVESTQTINVTLTPNVEKLDEVIVIGYGTQKKSDKTGAVTNVAAAELNTGVLTDPIQGMVGKVAGLQITKKGGNPNDGFSVQLRGSAGFATGNSPLYVIDGVPGVDPTTVSTDDIENYNVLKDASSCAIYGSRGANGVIIITTKKGKSGNSQVSFDSYIAMEKVAKRLDLLSADEIRSFVKKNGLTLVDAGGNTDWQDEIYKTAITQNYSLAISGGKDNTAYRISGNWADYQGVILGTDKQRFNLTTNLTQKLLKDKLTIEGSMFATFEKNNYENFGGNSPTDVMYQAFQRSPLQPVKKADGTYYENTGYGFQYFNPIAIINDIQNNRSAKRFRGNLSAELVLLKGLTFKANGSYTRNDEELFYFEPSTTASTLTKGKGSRSYNNTENKILETFVTYNSIFAEKHTVTFTGGYSWQKNTNDGFNAYGTNAQSPSLTSNNLAGLAGVSYGSIGSYKNDWTLISFFGRVLYSYDQRYAITATLRRDGSSKFGKNNKWGMFPSGSVAWTIKNESFLQNVNYLSQLKLRLGYGRTGNTEGFNPYWSLPITVAQGMQPSLDDGSNVIVFGLQRDANPDLKWEEVEEYNLGIDYGFMANKIQGSIELYNRNTNNMIDEYSLPTPPSYAGKVIANAGAIRNQGVEVNLQFQALNRININYKTTLTFSKIINKVTKLVDPSSNLRWNGQQRLYISARGMVGQWTQYIEEGHSIGSWYLPHYVGLSSDGARLYQTAAGGVTRTLSNAPRFYCGSALPKINIGWSNYFMLYKNIDASFSLHAILGYKVYNVSDMYFSDPKLLPNFNANKQAIAWFENKIDGTPIASDQWLEDGSFVRLDNFTIGYSVPLVKKWGINKLRFYVTGNNLLTITSYSGIDPEISYSGVEFGLDNFNVYPKTRSFIFGVQLNF